MLLQLNFCKMLDIVFIVIIAVSFVYGIIKGAIQEIFGIGGIVAGIIVATKTYKGLAPIIPLSDKIANVVSFIIILVFVAVVIYVIGLVIRKIVYLIKLGFLDRLVGGILGALKGSIIAGLVGLLISLIPGSEKHIANSYIYPALKRELNLIRGLFPEDIKNKLKWRSSQEEKPFYLPDESVQVPFALSQKATSSWANQAMSLKPQEAQRSQLSHCLPVPQVPSHPPKLLLRLPS
jgi:membrane protein required for colicin V production